MDPADMSHDGCPIHTLSEPLYQKASCGNSHNVRVHVPWNDLQVCQLIQLLHKHGASVYVLPCEASLAQLGGATEAVSRHVQQAAISKVPGEAVFEADIPQAMLLLNVLP